MTFREIPPQHAPLGDALYYAVGSDRAQTFEVRIRSDSGELLGAKRFADVAEARFDLAPYLRRSVRFTPAAGGTGPVPSTGRMVTATAEAGERNEEERTAASQEIGTDRVGLCSEGVHDTDRAAVTKRRSEGLGSTAPQTDPNLSGDTGPKTIPDGIDCAPAETGGAATNAMRAAESLRENALQCRATEHAAMSERPEVRMTESTEAETSATVREDITEAAKSGSATAFAARAETDGWHLLATAPLRTFLACETPVAAPALLTTMPLCRMIGPAECDELTLLTEGPIRVAVTARSPYSDTAEVHRIQSAGLHLFRVDLGEFPDAETLTIEAEACGTVCYTVVPPPDGACRLAWRSAAGSIEHYTFPVVFDTTVRIGQRARGSGGAVRWKERTTTLRSAYEVREVLEPLSEILSAPQVWLLQNGSYTPVEVASDQATVQRHGAMSCLEIVLRSKTRTPWN